MIYHVSSAATDAAALLIDGSGLHRQPPGPQALITLDVIAYTSPDTRTLTLATGEWMNCTVHNTARGVVLQGNAAQIRELARRGDVERITPIIAKERQNASSVVDTKTVNTWTRENTGYTGKDVTIAVVDSGVDYTHSDFGGPGTAEAYQKAKDILEGRKIDPTFYPVIYGAKEDEDWTNPEVWKRSNPSLGITVGIDKVQAACDSARQNPAEENSFRQLRLNQWVEQSVRWMPMDKWDACAIPVNAEALEGRVCYGGLDLSSTMDITAFVLVFPPTEENEPFAVLPYFWIPEENIDLRVRRDHVPYDVWERQGFLMTTEGNVVHYGFIEAFIEKLGEKYNIREIAFDRWGAVQMVQNLEGMGFTVVPFGQGFKDMSPPTKELMKLTLEKKIAHGGHPVMRWMADNIFIRTDPAGNIKADKEKSTEKIDGVIALIMALDRAIRCGNDTSESVYESRGVLAF